MAKLNALSASMITLICASSSSSQSIDCMTAIKNAFNISISKTGATNSSSFKKWQCSVEFSSHDEAIASGLNVGAVIQGVPLQIGGNFDKAKTEQWKKTNCSDEQRSADSKFEQYSFIKTYAPEAAALAAKCIDIVYGPRAVGCTLEGGNTPVFTSEWRRTSGDNRVPIVRSFTVFGGECTPAPKRNSKLIEGGRPSICTPGDGKDMVIALETDRGSCFQTRAFNPNIQAIFGKTVLSSDRVINADIVEFQDGAIIETNGYKLIVTALREIRGSGSAKITSFTENSPGRSLHGRNGGNIVLQAPRITGGIITVENFGEDGMQGKQGDTGPQGREGHGHRRKAFKGCVGRRHGEDGGQGFKGGDGGSGGRGGLVAINIANGLTSGAVSRVMVAQERRNSDGTLRTCSGSCGGNGGLGGLGGNGGPGGRGDEGKDGCGGAKGGNPGPTGSHGNAGANGLDVPVSMLIGG